MGRTQEAQEGQTGSARERMLAEALVLFYTYGIRGVGVDLLIARSGVAKASFYRHFPSKQALVVAYLDRREEAWLTWLRQEVEARATEPAARLVAIFDVLADQCTDSDYRGCAVINAVAEVGTEAPQVVERAQFHTSRLADYCAGLAAEAGIDQPAAIGEQWVLLVKGAMVLAMYDPGPAAPLRARATAAAMLDGHGAPPTATQ